MSGQNPAIGQVLGASTAIGGGVAMLPNTGGSPLGTILCLLAIILGSICLASFILTRLLRQILAK